MKILSLWDIWIIFFRLMHNKFKIKWVKCSESVALHHHTHHMRLRCFDNTLFHPMLYVRPYQLFTQCTHWYSINIVKLHSVLYRPLNTSLWSYLSSQRKKFRLEFFSLFPCEYFGSCMNKIVKFWNCISILLQNNKEEKVKRNYIHLSSYDTTLVNWWKCCGILMLSDSNTSYSDIFSHFLIN